MFGINESQTSEAAAILQEVSSDWRDLLAGSEGFLTGKEHRGLYRQEVVWGEMVRYHKCDCRIEADLLGG